MVAVGSEQFILGTLGLALAGGRVQPFNPAHDQPGGDVLVLLAGGEVRVGDLGDLGIRYPPALVLVPDGLGVLDPNPGILGDAGDRGDGRLIVTGGDRETRPASAYRRGDLVVVEGAVGARRDAPGGPGPAWQCSQVSVIIEAAPQAEEHEPCRVRVPEMTGAAAGVQMVATRAFRPFTPLYPYPLPCLAYP